ncbi:MAG: FAD-binding oxidoreductase [Gammaproteobacteria bacterium]|nr:FAD-binding oxidoreductase [Gammaproteobacteria bacterium]
MTDLIERLKSIVGPGAWKTEPADLEPNLTEWRGTMTGSTPIMVSPRTTAEVAEVVSACAEKGVGVVAQGGNTSLCGGSIPDESGRQILLSLSRLNRIRHIDRLNFSIEVEAGCVLATVQQAARNTGRYFPLSLGAEGSCQIGGNLATNAGGMNVIRYGTARAQVLGLEVVLADGSVLSTLRSLQKDTAGYDLKQLFVGSEGTLGIITAATLRLYPDPGETTTALIALRDSGDAVGLLADLRGRLGDRIEAFELVSGPVFDLVERHIPGAGLPFDDRYPWYALTEVATAGDPEILHDALMESLDQDRVLDVVIAKNRSESDRLWQMRHSIAEAERQDGPALKHDISVPVSAMQSFLQKGDSVLSRLVPMAQLLAFGHVGDGNLHYNVKLPDNIKEGVSSAIGKEVSTAIYDLVAEAGGSFSAEHGVGVTKKALLERYRGGVELELMRRLKTALDPDNILNPGKVI